MLKRALLVLAMASTLLGVGAASPALADDKGKAGGVGIQSCVYYSSTGANTPYGGGNYSGSGDWYAYSPTWTKPSWSSCNDIQSPYRNGSGAYPTPLNTWFRVRFYPSSGGSYANSWKSNNIGVSQNLIIATNVASGAVFRIEVHRRLVDGTQVVDPGYNFDVMF